MLDPIGLILYAVVLLLLLIFMYCPLLNLIRSLVRAIKKKPVSKMAWKSLGWSVLLSLATSLIFIRSIWTPLGEAVLIIGPIYGLALLVLAWKFLSVNYSNWDGEELEKPEKYWFANVFASTLVLLTAWPHFSHFFNSPR